MNATATPAVETAKPAIVFKRVERDCEENKKTRETMAKQIASYGKSVSISERDMYFDFDVIIDGERRATLDVIGRGGTRYYLRDASGNDITYGKNFTNCAHVRFQKRFEEFIRQNIAHIPTLEKMAQDHAELVASNDKWRAEQKALKTKEDAVARVIAHLKTWRADGAASVHFGSMIDDERDEMTLGQLLDEATK